MGIAFPATFDATFTPTESWQINGQAVPQQQSETVTPSGITLSWRATTQTLTNVLRPLKSDEGKVEVLERDNGGYVAVDRANGSNTYTLTPPSRREPLRFERDVHVRKYEEDLVGPDVGEWQVEVEFAKSAPRTDDPTASEVLNGQAFPATFDWTFGARDAEWKFTTPQGSLVSSRVDAEFKGTGEEGVRRFELLVRFTSEQARVWESAFARLGGGRVREIPDAPNVAVDDTEGSATVDVNAPQGGVVGDGEYVVREWSSRRISDAYQEVGMVIAQK